MRRISLPDRPPILIARLKGAFFAADDTCTHTQASLSSGQLVADPSGRACIECPRHGARFDLTTGAVRALPAVRPLRTYAVTVQDDSLYLTLE